MSIDLRGLRNFVAVASAGSISRAAENQHIAQPALSTQIKLIEDDLGVRLFERNSRGVRLTSAGELYLSHVIDILKRVDIATEDVREAIKNPSGRVALGLSQSLAKFLTVPLVGEIVKRWPLIHFQMIEMSTGYIPDQIVKGHLDLGLTFGIDEGVGISYSHLLDEELVFATSPTQLALLIDSRVIDSNSITFQAMKKFNLILPTRTHSLRKRIDGYLDREAEKLNVIAEVNTIPQLMELTAANVGSTILSYGSIDSDMVAKNRITLRHIKPKIFRPVYLCHSSVTPPSIAVSCVQDLIQEMVQNMISDGRWPTETNSSY